MLGSEDPSWDFYDGRILIILNCFMSLEKRPQLQDAKANEMSTCFSHRLVVRMMRGAPRKKHKVLGGMCSLLLVALSGSTAGVVVSLLCELRGFAPIAVLLSSDLHHQSLPLTMDLVQCLQLAFDHVPYESVQPTPHIKYPTHHFDRITVALELSTCLQGPKPAGCCPTVPML